MLLGKSVFAALFLGLAKNFSEESVFRMSLSASSARRIKPDRGIIQDVKVVLLGGPDTILMLWDTQLHHYGFDTRAHAGQC